MQHSASPRAVLTTRHSPCAVFFIHTHGSALTITYSTAIAIVCVIKGSEFCYNKSLDKININPLATNATIGALVIKNKITYYDITHS